MELVTAVGIATENALGLASSLVAVVTSSYKSKRTTTYKDVLPNKQKEGILWMQNLK